MNNEVFSNIPKPVVLVIFDGFGAAPSWGGNAISAAKMPNYAKLLREMPNTVISAAGEAVGLPDSEEGNSEVGHLNIGSGIAIEQEITRINKLIQTGQFFKNNAFLQAIRSAKLKNTTVHLMGILSHGVVHGDLDHLKALIKLCSQEGVKKVSIHLFSDGRDCPPYQSLNYLGELKKTLGEYKIGQVSSLIGRYFAMDRDKHWDRTEKAYDLLTKGIGAVVNSPEAAISKAYREGFSDEFIPAFAIRGVEENIAEIKDGDSVIFYNYRGDRARQLTQAFVEKDFKEFERKKILKDIYFVTFTNYKEGLPVNIAFLHDKVEWPLAKILSHYGKTQLHIAETEKYAHVTYFFNGGHEKPFEKETDLLIPSPKVSTYDLQPEMSAEEVTTKLIEAIQTNKYDFIVVNYANPDMVGHTGNMVATIKALEFLDKKIAQITSEIAKSKGLLIITADHGNCEQMINSSTGEMSTDHTNNKVPFIIFNDDGYRSVKLHQDGALRDVTPTILDIMHLQQPTEMTGRSLLDMN